MATIEQMEKLTDSTVKMLRIAEKKNMKYQREKVSVKWRDRKS